jgi:hypothetical protein
VCKVGSGSGETRKERPGPVLCPGWSEAQIGAGVKGDLEMGFLLLPGLPFGPHHCTARLHLPVFPK